MKKFTLQQFKNTLLLTLFLFIPISLLADCSASMRVEQGTSNELKEMCKKTITPFVTTCIDGNQSRQGKLNECTIKDSVSATFSMLFLEYSKDNVIKKQGVILTTNSAPTIEGNPKKTITVYDLYQALFVANDINNDILTFSIENSPSWAEFNTTTGLLQGIPPFGSEGSYSNIIISVNDGSKTAYLAPFSIEVGSEIDMAYEYGTATQGSTSYGKPAFNVVDKNISTFNHTSNNNKNWLQIELLYSTNISKIMIQNRNSSGTKDRLNNAKVYIMQDAYNGTLDENNLVGTLQGILDEQIITFTEPRNGKYILVKAAEDQYLHLATVEVYGNFPSIPKFNDHRENYLIPSNTSIGYSVVTVDAIDHQNDTIIYTIDNPAFAIDSHGAITVNSTNTSGIYTLIVTASDGINSTTTAITVGVTSLTAVEDALLLGDSSLVTKTEIYDKIDEIVTLQTEVCKETLDYIYPNGLESTKLGKISTYFTSVDNTHIPLHVSNNNAYSTYSVLGTKQNGTRYVFFGANVMLYDKDMGVDVEEDINRDLKGSILNTMKWLLKKENTDDILSQNLTIAYVSHLAKTSLSTFLSDNSLEHNWTITNNATVLADNSYDILITFSNRMMDEGLLEIKDAINNNKPVIILNDGYGGHKDILRYFKLNNIKNAPNEIGNFSSTAEVCEKASIAQRIKYTIDNLENNRLDFDYSEDVCPNEISRVDCKVDLLLNHNGKTLGDEFKYLAQTIEQELEFLDEQSLGLFNNENNNTLLKLIVLLADKYREEIVYPMDKVTTDDSVFYKALFADNAVLYARDISQHQLDMGDFSSNPAVLKDLEITTESISMTPTNFSEWSSTGIYTLPGKTITVRRTDKSDNNVSIKFNIIRRATTRLWNENQYTRPQYMESHVFAIEKGRDYNISTPYGGPIYIHWEAVESNAVPFTLEFENVIKNPFLDEFDSDSIDTFATQLDDSLFDWVDIKTPFLEIHSLKSKMQEAVTTYGFYPYDGDIPLYLTDLKTYLVDNNLNLAAFKGDGLSLSTEVQTFCSEFDLDCSSDIHSKPKIQHVNSDIHAACGGGCAGNPFDTSKPVSPTGIIESHEYGHGLQRKRLNFYGRKSGETSNVIFVVHTNWKYLVDHNIDKHHRFNLSHNDKAYEFLQNAISNNTAVNENHPLWIRDGTYDESNSRLEIYIQLVYIHQSWDIYPKLYLIERLFTDAISSDDKWNANKSKLGFSSYTKEEAKAIIGNNFMAVVLSKFTKKDHRDIFEAWGIEVSTKAKEQIETNEYPDGTVPRLFYKAPDRGLYKILPTETLPLDGTTTYD